MIVLPNIFLFNVDINERVEKGNGSNFLPIRFEKVALYTKLNEIIKNRCRKRKKNFNND